MTWSRSRAAGALALGACAALALGACGGSSGSGSASGGGGSNTITFVAAQYSDATQGYWQDLIKKFEKAYPGKHVNLDVVNWNDITQKVDTLVANHQQPDILNLNAFASFARSDLLYPVDQVTSAKTRQDFLPTFADNDKYNGTQYALPFIASDRQLFYNKDIFAKAGISAPPKTWDELLADAQKIKKTGSIGYGLPLGAEEAQAEWEIWMWGGGGDWKSGDKWTVNSATNIQTMQFVSDLANKYKVTEQNPGLTNRTDGVWRLFAAGKIGMCMGSPGTFIGMLDKSPNVHYGIAQTPVKSGNPEVTLGVQDVLMAFKKSGNQETVKQFLDFFYQPANYTKLLTNEGFLPTTQSGISKLQSNPKFGPYLQALSSARFAPEADPAWPKVQAAVQHQIGLGVQPGHDPKSVLDQLQQTAEQAAQSG